MSIDISFTIPRGSGSSCGQRAGVELPPAPGSRQLGWVVGLWLLAGCSPRLIAADAADAGDDPRVNQVTSAPSEDVPFCPGGDRGKHCVLGANCRVTERGCQVCQCLSP